MGQFYRRPRTGLRRLGGCPRSARRNGASHKGLKSPLQQVANGAFAEMEAQSNT
jgi:hypothetical protein